MSELKMYCIFAKESVAKMNGNRGKLGAMSGHAFLHAFWNSEGLMGEDAHLTSGDYRYGDHAVKICLLVETVEELKAIEANYAGMIGTSLVTDAARTVFAEPTTVCLGLGPVYSEDLNDDVKQLKVFM